MHYGTGVDDFRKIQGSTCGSSTKSGHMACEPFKRRTLECSVGCAHCLNHYEDKHKRSERGRPRLSCCAPEDHRRPASEAHTAFDALRRQWAAEAKEKQAQKISAVSGADSVSTSASDPRDMSEQAHADADATDAVADVGEVTSTLMADTRSYTMSGTGTPLQSDGEADGTDIEGQGTSDQPQGTTDDSERAFARELGVISDDSNTAAGHNVAVIPQSDALSVSEPALLSASQRDSDDIHRAAQSPQTGGAAVQSKPADSPAVSNSSPQSELNTVCGTKQSQQNSSASSQTAIPESNTPATSGSLPMTTPSSGQQPTVGTAESLSAELTNTSELVEVQSSVPTSESSTDTQRVTRGAKRARAR